MSKYAAGITPQYVEAAMKEANRVARAMPEGFLIDDVDSTLTMHVLYQVSIARHKYKVRRHVLSNDYMGLNHDWGKLFREMMMAAMEQHVEKKLYEERT